MPKTGNLFTVKVAFNITPAMSVKFSKYCIDNGITKSEALRNCLRVVLREEEFIDYADKGN